MKLTVVHKWLLPLAITISSVEVHANEHRVRELVNSGSSLVDLKNQLVRQNLMEHSTLVENNLNSDRKLEDNEYGGGDDYSFLDNYSLKFQGCWHKEDWNFESYKYKHAPKVITRRFVKFRLCPKDSCSDRKPKGCKKDYAEFVTDMNTFVDAFQAETIENDNFSAKFIRRSKISSCRRILNSCGCYQSYDDDWVDDVQEFGECFDNCIANSDSAYCEDFKENLEMDDKKEEEEGENGNGYYGNGYYDYGQDGDGNYVADVNYDDMYWEDDLYDDDADANAYNEVNDEDLFLYRYSRCKLWSKSGKIIDDAADEADEGAEDDVVSDFDSSGYYPYLYLGPFCGNQGSSIFLGMFTDRTCSNYADKSGGRNSYYKMTKEQLPYSRTSMVTGDCIPCSENYDGFMERKQICTVLYDSSGKCEKNLKADKEKINNSCSYLNKIKVIDSRYSVDLNDNETAQAFIWVFFTSCLLLGSYVGYLKWKIYENKKANPDSVYFYD